MIEFGPILPAGTHTAGTLTFATTEPGLFPLDLFFQNGSSFSTAIFDGSYMPRWDIQVQGTPVTVQPGE